MRFTIPAMTIAALIAFGTLSVHAASGDVKTKGKTLYVWHLDEGTGKKVSESGKKGPDGEFMGAPKWTDGISGKAIQFEGDGNYVSFAGNDHLDITEQLTMAAWVRLTAHPQGDQAKKGTIFFKNTYYLQIEPVSGSLAYYFYDTGAPGYHLSKGQVPLNRWAHVALIWDGAKATFYIDGKADSSVDQKGPGRTMPAINLLVGGENNACCPRFYQGILDDLAIANYAMTEAELSSLMNAALTVDPVGKTATAWGALKK